MSLVFNTSNLSRNNIDTRKKNEIVTRNIVTESYFASTCDFLIEANQSFDNASKLLYRSVLESNNDTYVINESFDNFFDKIKEIVDKIVEFIKSLAARFITALNKFVSSDKYIAKHKNDFSKFKSKNEFEFDGYNYTFKPDIPNIHALAQFNDEFVYGSNESAALIKSKFDKLSKAGRDHTDDLQKDVIGILTEYYNGLIDNLEGDYYDNFRSKLINADSNIPFEDYVNELYCTFRDGSSDTERITANTTYIHNAVARYMNHDKAINEVKKYQKDVEKEYGRLKKQISEMQEVSYKTDNKSITLHFADLDPVTVTYTNELTNTINTWLKCKVNQVQEMSNIHSLAFSTKLDALTQSYQQDKTVLYHALNEIQKIQRESALDDVDKVFDKNEKPEISVGSTARLISGDIYETPIKTSDIYEREPAKVSKTAKLLKDVKLS